MLKGEIMDFRVMKLQGSQKLCDVCGSCRTSLSTPNHAVDNRVPKLPQKSSPLD